MWETELYQKENGGCPVAEFLSTLSAKQHAKALRSIDLLGEKGTGLGMPFAEHVEGNIWQLRIQFSGDIQRIFYFLTNKKRFVLLHGFVKKTSKTPESEKATARTYYQDYERRYHDEF